MPKESRRPDRVAAAIREEIANFLAGGVKDPRVAGLVTVTGVGTGLTDTLLNEIFSKLP